MPDFAADYGGMDTCSGWWADIDLNNTGGVTFKSIAITVRDIDTDVVVSMYTDVFHDIDGCSDTSTRERLNPGDSQWSAHLPSLMTQPGTNSAPRSHCAQGMGRTARA